MCLSNQVGTTYSLRHESKRVDVNSGGLYDSPSKAQLVGGRHTFLEVRNTYQLVLLSAALIGLKCGGTDILQSVSSAIY